MKKIKILSKPRIYISLLLLFVILLFIMPRTVKFNYDYKKGTPWNYTTLVAECDFPILKTETQIEKERKLKGTKIIPYYKFSNEVVNEYLKKAESLDLGKYSYIKPEIVKVVNFIYSIGVLSNQEVYLAEAESEGVEFSDELIYVQKNKHAYKRPLNEVFEVSEAKDKLYAKLSSKYLEVNIDSLYNAVDMDNLIVPSLIFDKQATRTLQEESRNYISPTSGYVKEGQLIVSEGEIVTADTEQKLNSYKIEYEKTMGANSSMFLHWLGNALIAFSIILLLVLSLFYVSPSTFKKFNRFLYILTVFLISAVVTFSVEKTNSQLFYMVPYSLIAIYLIAFFKRKVIISVYVISLLPLLIFAHSGVQLFTMYLVSGFVTIYLFEFYNRGWKQFITAFIVFLSLVLVYLGFLFTGSATGAWEPPILYMFIGSLLSVAGYPLIYLFERIFVLVSNSRLLELCDTNNPLIRRLEHITPGTFQHSLQVMNMADTAARSIDANVLLIRAGALYHDIGKTMNPSCFIENESLMPEEKKLHYHSGLTPLESATQIIKHIPDGIKLAEEHHLPGIIIDFIKTHHGSTCTAFFYNKFVNDGGDPKMRPEFCYKWGKPHTKEQIILMLCDTLEAASRTLKDYSEDAISDFVESIVGGKLSDGQFENADITIRELNIVKETVKVYLKQLYHKRIVYPKRKN